MKECYPARPGSPELDATVRRRPLGGAATPGQRPTRLRGARRRARAAPVLRPRRAAPASRPGRARPPREHERELLRRGQRASTSLPVSSRSREKKLERPRDQLGLHLLLRLVDEGRHVAGLEAPAARELEQPEPLAPLDDDVSRPSSKRASTSATRARVPTSRIPSSSAYTSPNSEILVEALADELLVASSNTCSGTSSAGSRTSGSGREPSSPARSRTTYSQTRVRPDSTRRRPPASPRCDDRATRVDERSERPPEETLHRVLDGDRGTDHEQVAGEAQGERAARRPGRQLGELDAVGRAADDPVRRNASAARPRRILEEVRDGERRPALRGRGARRLEREGLERGDKLHDLAPVGPCRDGSAWSFDAAPDLEDAGTSSPCLAAAATSLRSIRSRPFAQ